MNKYFIYARKSSEQEDRQVLSLDSQVKELNRLAQESNLHIVDVYKESGSAHTIGRKDFNEMLTRIENSEANGLLVWDESRIARNSLDGGKIIYMIDLNQIIEIRKPGKAYVNTPDDKSWLALCFMMSKKESDDKSKNVKRGLNEKAEKGWLPNGAKPGYMNDKYAEKGNKTILTDPDRYPLIRKAWDLMLTGKINPTEILEKLNNEWGYRTSKRRSIGGKPMARSMIYSIFTDPFYYGEFEFPKGSGIWHKGQHTPMVTKDEYDNVQIILGRKGRPRPKTHKFNYRGLMRCGECGAGITCEEKIKKQLNGNVHRYIYYHCTKRKDPKCSQGSIEEKELEEQVDNILSKIQISEEFKEWAIKYLNEANETEVSDRSAILSSLKLAYDDVVKRIDNLVALKISPNNSDNSLLSDDEFKLRKDSLMREKENLNEKLSDTDYRIDNWIELTEKTFEFACYSKYWFSNGDQEAKRQIFMALGSNLVLKDKILLPNLEKPLEYIKEMVKNEPSISKMLEPEEKTAKSSQMGSLWSINPTMLRD